MRNRHRAYQNEVAIFGFGVTAKDFSHGVLRTVPCCTVDQRRPEGEVSGEFQRVIVGAENRMKERFGCALHNDGLAGRPANIRCCR